MFSREFFWETCGWGYKSGGKIPTVEHSTFAVKELNENKLDNALLILNGWTKIKRLTRVEKKCVVLSAFSVLMFVYCCYSLVYLDVCFPMDKCFCYYLFVIDIWLLAFEKIDFENSTFIFIPKKTHFFVDKKLLLFFNWIHLRPIKIWWNILG